MCWQAGELIDMVNSELYSMEIQRDCGRAWYLMKAVFSLCRKMCLKYTNFNKDSPGIDAIDNTLDCVREVKRMLRHLKYCSLRNPRDNLTGAKLNFMMRLMQKAVKTMKSFLHHIERTHRNVQAE